MAVESGTVTILFTDLVGSTELLERAGDEQAQRIFKAHQELLRKAVAEHRGHEVKWLGDGLMVTFSSAADAVRCAVAMQQAARRPAAGERLQIRVGLNVGEAIRDESDYFGTPVVIAKRLCDRADAGQIYASDLVVRLLSGRQEFRFDDMGALALKGIGEPVQTLEAVYHHDPAAMLAHTPFVGRTEEVAQLHQLLEAARGGRGSVAMLVGEPGIGKTRTAEEFCDYARGTDAVVLWGRCYDGEWAPPFSPFTEAIRKYTQATDDDAHLRSVLANDGPIVARLVPQLRERIPDLPEPPALPPEGERYRLLDAVSGFFARASTLKPLVIVLDDLHWADRSTAALMLHCARELRASRVLLLGMYRDIEVDRQHPLTSVLADMRRDTTPTRIELVGLEAPEVEELLDVIATQPVAADLAKAIAQETGGNPFFIREVLLHLAAEGKFMDHDGRWTSPLTIAEIGIPEGVREVIGRRISSLGEASRRMLTLLSAMAGGFTWAEVTAIADEPEDSLLDALDEVLATHLLREVAPSTFDFPHALIRHTLHDTVTTPRRVALHRQIGEALENLYEHDIEPHLAELAHHFYQAASGGDARTAIDYCRRAADLGMETLAFDEAALNYERAASLVASSSPVDHSAQAELLLARAHAFFLAGRDDDSLEAFAEVADVARLAGRADLFARAATREFNRFGTRPEPWPSLLREALELLPAEDSHARAIVMTMRGGSFLPDSGLPIDRSLVEDAITMARRLDDPETLALTLHYKCWMLAGLDVGDELLSVADEYDALGRFPDSSSYWRLIALYRMGEMGAADRELERNVQVCEETRLPQFRALARFIMAMREIMKGNFAEGERLSALGLQLGQGWQYAQGWFLSQTMSRLREQGRPPPIDTTTLPVIWDQATTFAIAADSAAMRGEIAEARSIIERVASLGLHELPRNSAWLITLALLAEACAIVGDRQHAGALLGLLEPHEMRPVVAGHATVCLGSVAQYLGRLATTLERFDDAERYFERALEDDSRWEARPSLARTEMNYAEMLLGRDGPGDRERGSDLLQRALAAAREMGMAGVAANCEALLASA